MLSVDYLVPSTVVGEVSVVLIGELYSAVDKHAHVFSVACPPQRRNIAAQQGDSFLARFRKD